MSIKQKEQEESEYLIIASPGPESEVYLTTTSSVSPESAVEDSIRMAKEGIYNSIRKEKAALMTDMFIVFNSSDMERVFVSPDESKSKHIESIDEILSKFDSGSLSESETIELIRDLVSE